MGGALCEHDQPVSRLSACRHCRGCALAVLWLCRPAAVWRLLRARSNKSMQASAAACIAVVAR
eukprot:6183613-Pleurochrysis_carterae.AAC.1